MHIEKKTLRNIFLVAVGCIFLYWLLHETERAQVLFGAISDVLAPFVIGACLAFVLNVPMRAFENLLKGIKNAGLRRVVAICLTIICVLLVITLVFVLLIPQMIETIQSLVPKISDFLVKVETWIITVLETNQEYISWSTVIETVKSFDWAKLIEQMVSFLGTSVETILIGALSAIGKVAGLLFNTVVAIVFALYCLFQKETLARQGRKLLYAFAPERVADEIIRIMRLSNSTFSNFLSGQCIEVCILGLLFAVSMAIFGMPYIPLVSVLVAVTAFIPVVGAWIGCVLGAFLIFVANPLQAVWFVVMFLVLQQIENNLIYPRVVGNSIGLSGMWVLFAVAVGGALMGAIGMLLMIPVASVLYSLIREYTGRRLAARDVPAEKLKEQPPELNHRFKRKRMTTQPAEEAEKGE